MKRIFAALFLTGLCCVPAPAATESSISIHGIVPLICRVDFLPASAVQDGQVQLGTLQEFCNSGYGYQVVADYPSTDDPGMLVIDGQRVTLSGSGHAVLAVMDGPRAINQTLAYVPGKSPITAIRIQLLPGAI
jgi:hypothetical protein